MLNTEDINPYILSLIVFVTQIIFVYLRTLNIMHISEHKIIPAMLSGSLMGVCWLITIKIGIDSISSVNNWQPILGFFLGGAFGTYYAIKNKQKKEKNEIN